MFNNLFAHYKKLIRQRDFLASRLVLINAVRIYLSTTYLDQISYIEEEDLSVEKMFDKDVNEYWEQFKSKNNQESLAIYWHPSTGTPITIFGKLAKFEVASEENARKFLLENKQGFKFSDSLGDLTLSNSFETPIGKHFVFEQKYKDISIAYGGRVGISFNHNTEIIAISNTYLPNIKFDSIKPNIKQEAALAVAKLILKMRQAIDLDKMDKMKINIVMDDKPIIHLFNKKIRLVWRFVISIPNNTWEMFIDAQNNISLGKPRDINQYFIEGKGKVFNINPIVATCNFRVDVNDIPPEAYKEVILKGLNGNGYLDGEYASSANTSNRIHCSDNNFVFTHEQDGFAETMIYYYIDYTQRYIQELGFNNISNRTIVYNAKANENSSSYYHPASKTLFFNSEAKGGGKDAEIIIHEYGHAIQNDQIPGFGLSGESAAISEGFADYLAASMTAHLTGNSNDRNGYTYIGEWGRGGYRHGGNIFLPRIDTDKKISYRL
ncbi:MAG: M36 family metallopeptidase [Blastocatellia bacterium]